MEEPRCVYVVYEGTYEYTIVNYFFLKEEDAEKYAEFLLSKPRNERCEFISTGRIENYYNEKGIK